MLLGTILIQMYVDNGDTFVDSLKNVLNLLESCCTSLKFSFIQIYLLLLKLMYFFFDFFIKSSSAIFIK